MFPKYPGSWPCTLPKGSISRLILPSGLAWGLESWWAKENLQVGRRWEVKCTECWERKPLMCSSGHKMIFILFHVFYLFLFSCLFFVWGLFYSPIIAKLFQHLTNDYENIFQYFHAVVSVEVLHPISFYLFIHFIYSLFYLLWVRWIKEGKIIEKYSLFD